MYRRLISLLCGLSLSTVLQAAVFKCISPSGQHSYQDHPCPADHVAHTLKRGYFSQISREPYQLDIVKLQQKQPTWQERQLQREQHKTQRQLQQALKICNQLRSRQHKLQGQLQRSRSARQTLRLQERLASQQQALQDAACIP
ncbi:hypothetical protein [Aquitalea denitrificans]|uniref:hypothetical protein n=1 Tax=Aquitalea denitrificans TaxID=519081 RepID=UPI00135B3814|nr:hypothetical protein [Aquitalea denitrificans]